MIFSYDSHVNAFIFQTKKMGIYHIFIVSKSGGLIFNYDHNVPQQENEKVRTQNNTFLEN